MKESQVLNSLTVFLITVSLSQSAMAQTVKKNTSSYPYQKELVSNDVSWNTLGSYSADSMPLGNGDIGLNVWTEQNGDVLFYISKTDALDEAASPVKVGRVRVSLSPNPFLDKSFNQVLSLENGEIQISGGKGNERTVLHIWVDAKHPVVKVEAIASKPINIKVTLDPWRVTPTSTGTNISADVVLPSENNSITWYHRDTKPRSREITNLTFGASIQGQDMISGEDNTLKSASPKNIQRLSVYPYTSITPNIQDWQIGLHNLVSTNKTLDWKKTFQEHQQWWKQFWQRSYIFVKGDADADKVTQGYILQRFITACAGRGAHAIKFNGTLFTMDNPAENKGKDKVTGINVIKAETADFRAWGGQYWFQNTRPLYWPLLAEGDYDMMQPLFRQVLNMLPGNSALVKKYYNHDGFYFAETANYWGGVPNILPTSKGSYTLRYFTPVLEMSTMMLDYYDYTGNKQFLRDTLMPIANAGLTFFAQHFPKDEQGRLLLYPDNSIEMYWDVSNPLPDIAGLHYVIDRLLALPPSLTKPSDRDKWSSLQKILPEIPIGTKNGIPVILPFVDIKGGVSHNTENPELYAVYPFRIYGLGKPDLQLAINTFNTRISTRAGCWYQDAVQAALLGITDIAKKDVMIHFNNFDKRLRFPGFWERGHDYMPDQDNGGNGQLALQKMLMQCDGKKVLLLPAWPKEWSANFKLNAPYNTVIECSVVSGKIVNIKVTPESRKKDIEVYSAKSL